LGCPVTSAPFKLGDVDAELGALGRDIVQASDGVAKIVGVRLSNAASENICWFCQGELGIFEFEFEILKPQNGRVLVPSLAVRDMADEVIYCRDGLQRGIGVTDATEPGNRIRCRQGVELDLRPGKYSFTVGLYSVDAEVYGAYQRREIPHLQFRQHVTVHVSAKVGTFSVDFDRHGQLRHYGLADLPAELVVNVLAPRAGMAEMSVRADHCVMSDTTLPTIAHVTHWKAGSQWIRTILCSLAPERVIQPRPDNSQFLVRPVAPGGVYPTLYVSRNDYELARLPKDVRRLVVFRDLRDTLVSGYFSLLYSHEDHRPEVNRYRKALSQCGVEDGMMLLMDEWLSASARIQVSWIEADEPVIRYEDLLERDLDILVPVLRDRLGFDAPTEQIERTIVQARFEQMAGGRRRGQEDRSAHQRKGIAGDWKNCFTDRISRAFKMRYGALLIETGYEKNLSW
jgi:Sulfotransferase domain/Wzt C-terminal domain